MVRTLDDHDQHFAVDRRQTRGHYSVSGSAVYQAEGAVAAVSIGVAIRAGHHLLKVDSEQSPLFSNRVSESVAAGVSRARERIDHGRMLMGSGQALRNYSGWTNSFVYVAKRSTVA